MNLTEELIHAINRHELFNITLFGKIIPITDTVVITWIIMAFLTALALFLTAGMKSVPEGKQNVAEALVEFVNTTTKGLIGHHWKHFAPYIGTIFLYLIMANTISIFNLIPDGEQLYKLTHIKALEHFPGFAITPPTRDFNVTASMAIMSIIMVLFAGIRFKGFSGWIKSFAEPMPVIVPFKILDYFVRPLSLCFRLFGNILGAFILMELIYIAIPLFVPAVFSIYFDLFDGMLQAYIFIFLTSLYVAEAIE